MKRRRRAGCGSSISSAWSFTAPATRSSDAEVILLGHSLFERFGVKGVRLEINSIGCPACRAKYFETLKAYFGSHREELCGTCLDRLERKPDAHSRLQERIVREGGRGGAEDDRFPCAATAARTSTT